MRHKGRKSREMAEIFISRAQKQSENDKLRCEDEFEILSEQMNT